MSRSSSSGKRALGIIPSRQVARPFQETHFGLLSLFGKFLIS